MIFGVRGDKCYLFLILGGQGNLVITLKSFQKLILGCLYVTSTNWSIFGIGNESFGHAQFKSVKSMQTLHLPFFFFTTTVFASHSGKKISLIALASFNLLTSYLIASTCSLADFLDFFFLGGNDGSTLSLWTMNSGSTSGTSYGLQANTFIFCIRNSNVSTLSSSSYLPLLENTCQHLVVFLL